ncbi:Crp/Fnr family transcriptional regulator [Eubacterium oxidoreducens]|uniref:Cyclic nucleotide-binding domain-containing protein n=1 Tax=Eubacterium oxidoreducens TaxID=1732 RepID=A0A1G6CAN2_EUBOX|nr:Crp/Fnr family transcriptional regulator [Eubacterium oxidoreducens]SDB29947.1 hypothetical protein SAMN02910417_02234 [Eubacterium oxidoreducens]
MGLTNLEQDAILHNAGDIVKTLEIVVKGTIVVSDGDGELELPSGSLVGVFETPDQEYAFSYYAKEDSAVYSYEYNEIEDIRKVLSANPKLMQMITSKIVSSVKDTYDMCAQQVALAHKDYHTLMNQFEKYPALCIEVGETPEIFSEMLRIGPPPEDMYVPDWQIPFLDAIIEHDAALGKVLYGTDVDISAGIVFTTSLFVTSFVEECEVFRKYREEIHTKSQAFRQKYVLIEAKVNAVRSAQGIEGDEVPEIKNALDTILAYAAVSAEQVDEFKNLIMTYKGYNDRSSTTDELRMLRRKITGKFNEIYYAVFLESMKSQQSIPMEVRMFLNFGFVDEELAGEHNTEMIYKYVRDYKADREGLVVTMYEWLTKVYKGEVPPSRNEFDNDYEAQLREDKNAGKMTEEKYKELLVDNKNKMKFELTNMCASASRMTFGRVTAYVPIFDAQNLIMPIERCYMTAETLHTELNRVKAIDYSLFYRERNYSNPELELVHFSVQREILPYMIMMPNVGSRMGMWQEIEGRDRGTPARFVMPILMIEDVGKNIVQICGEFRWEMCKSIQGIRWSDIREPSLTSEYNDYIQCYKKNSQLSPEHKERIKKTLKKVGNNLRRAFVTDYVKYIQTESGGSPTMNKVARAMLFKYCPFSAEVRERIGANPQYTDLIRIFENHKKQKLHPVDLVIKKLNSKGLEIPEEVKAQMEFLEL